MNRKALCKCGLFAFQGRPTVSINVCQALPISTKINVGRTHDEASSSLRCGLKAIWEWVGEDVRVVEKRLVLFGFPKFFL